MERFISPLPHSYFPSGTAGCDEILFPHLGEESQLGRFESRPAAVSFGIRPGGVVVLAARVVVAPSQD